MIVIIFLLFIILLSTELLIPLLSHLFQLKVDLLQLLSQLDILSTQLFILSLKQIVLLIGLP